MQQGEFLDDLHIFFKVSDYISFYPQVHVKQSHFYKPDFERILQICHFHLPEFRISE